ncbi:MAG: hypothetical protein AAF580_09840 [Pseudomonadota bacterium]
MPTAAKTLPRRKPDPIPPIFPLPERLAEGRRKALYEDTKAVLHVPWMGVVTMAFAHYPHFYEALWGGVRPLCASAPFLAACEELRGAAQGSAASLKPGPMGPRLLGLGYDDSEIDDISAVIDIFSRGNMPYVLMATLARLVLERHTLSTHTQAAAPVTPRSVKPGSAFLLIERHHGNAELGELYDNIEATLGLPFVNTDYRALARWPSYLSLAWAGLAPHVPTSAYEAAVDTVHAEAVRLARALPNPGQLNADALAAAANADGAAEQIRETVALFQWLLPGLVTNMAFFEAQLAQSQ